MKLEARSFRSSSSRPAKRCGSAAGVARRVGRRSSIVAVRGAVPRRRRVPAVCLAALLAADAGAGPNEVAVEDFARTWRDGFGNSVDDIVQHVMTSHVTVVAGEFVAVFDPDDKHLLDNHRVTATFRVDEVFDGEEALAGGRTIEVALWSDMLGYPGEDVSRREKRERLLAPYYQKLRAIDARIEALDATEGSDPEARARARRELVAQQDALSYPLPRGLRESLRSSDWVDGGIRLDTRYVVAAELRPQAGFDPENSGYRNWIYAGLKAAAMIPGLRSFWARQSGGWLPYYADQPMLVDFAASDGREFSAVQYRLYPKRGYVDWNEPKPQHFGGRTVRLQENGYPKLFDGAFGEAPEAMFERLHAPASDVYDAAASAATGAAKFAPWRRFELGGRELVVNVKEVPSPSENAYPERSNFASRIDYPGLRKWRVRPYRAFADAKLVSFGERRFLVVCWIGCERYCGVELVSVELTAGP